MLLVLDVTGLRTFVCLCRSGEISRFSEVFNPFCEVALTFDLLSNKKKPQKAVAIKTADTATFNTDGFFAEDSKTSAVCAETVTDSITRIGNIFGELS